MERNYYDQHSDNHKKTILLNVLLPSVLLIVMPVIYCLSYVALFFASIFVSGGYDYYHPHAHGIDLVANQWNVVLATFLALLIWYFGILIYAHRQLKNPIETVMSEANAVKVTGVFGNQDAKSKTLLDVVEELSIAYDLKRPDIYVVNDTKEPNAFAFGDRDKSAVAITRPLLNMLNRSELSGVIGHELGHITNEDSNLILRFIAYVTGLSFFIDFGGWLATSVFSWDDWGLRATILKWVVFAVVGFLGLALALVGMFTKWLATLLRFATSRTREYDADAMSAQINQSADGLISALSKLEGYSNDDEKKEDKLKPVYSQLYFTDNRKGDHLMDDHPAISDRIKRLKEL